MSRKIHKTSLILLILFLQIIFLNGFSVVWAGATIQVDLSHVSSKPSGISGLTLSGVLLPEYEEFGTFNIDFIWDPVQFHFIPISATKMYPVHHNITGTVFWIGEAAGPENGYISNISSTWDEKWMEHYGGVDDPGNRHGFLPAAFSPGENPFYVALPYNDLDQQGTGKQERSRIVYWSAESVTTTGDTTSICKNRWVKIMKGSRTAYAQWEDAGPFGEDDAAYVFGDQAPANTVNRHAGIDLSPAVRDYLKLEDIDQVDWQFINAADVSEGPWSTVINKPAEEAAWFRPGLDDTWQWQLQGNVNTSYNASIYDVDLFDTDPALINRLHARGIKVICYFSAGSREEWRPDADSFTPNVLGKSLDGWPGERWLDIRSEIVRNIMLERMDLARSKGCDGVEPDNVDGYSMNTGFPLTQADQLDYNRFLAMAAHERMLAVGLKNDLDQVADLVSYFDFSIVEQCAEYHECYMLRPFTTAGKPVFQAEYADLYVNDQTARQELCNNAEVGFHVLILPKELDASFRYSCDE